MTCNTVRAIESGRVLTDPSARAAQTTPGWGEVSGVLHDGWTWKFDRVVGFGTWRMVAVDTDGCDLAPGPGDPTADAGAATLRIAWPHPVDDAAGVRAALIALLRNARDA